MASLTSETRKLLDDLAALGLPPLHSLTPSEAREMRSRVASIGGGGPTEPVAQVNDDTIAGSGTRRVPVRTYTPVNWPPGSGDQIVYAHGGGWVMGDLDTHDAPCRGLANAAEMRVTAVDYRLAPEARHPAPLDDVWDVVLARKSETGGRLFVGGDSAGGHIAANMAIRARDAGVELAGQLLVYPVTNLHSFDTPSYREFATDHWLTSDAMVWFRDHYLEGLADADDWVSPLLRTDLAGLAPAVLILAECDVLRDEGRAYAEALRASGTPVWVHEWAGVIHGFFAMPTAVPEGRDAVDTAGAELRRIAEEANRAG